MQPAYLIQFPTDKAYERALEAFFAVTETRCVFPDRRMLVTARHIEILDEHSVPYTKLNDSTNSNKPSRRSS